MSATNKTTNYELPIFIASDSPKWLVDWNGAMNTIDSAINTVATAASGAAGDITSLQSDLQTLSGTVTTQGTSISTLTSSLSTLTGTVNTITSLIGNGEPTTTDKTIIGAINELHADIQQIVVSVDADDVSYDNTTSGLLATNVQSAIDELQNEIASGGAASAADVSYSNTSSGLVATNVQSAIDELALNSESEFKRQFANKKILVFGDSLSVDDTTWVESLKTLASECGATVDNQSASGRTSSGGLTAVAGLTTPYDVAIVWLGINDSYSGVSIGVWSGSNNFSANMHGILAALHTLNPDMLIYVLGINYSTSLTYDKSKSTYSYNQALKQVANIDGAVFKNLDHLPNAAIQHSSALKQDGNHFKDDYSKTVLFDAILNKIIVPVSDDYDETLMIGSGLFTPGSGVTLTKGYGINVIGKFVYMNLLFTATAAATTLFTLPDIFDFSNYNVKITDINDATKVYFGVISGNTIGRGGVALTGGTYFAEIVGVMAENNNLQYV